MDGFEKYVGVVFDNRYKIEKIVGIGGMAVVYKAHDLLMRRVVAVKMLRDEIAADEQSVKRFINESKAVAMLSHPNIVNIYDVSVRDNVKYIVMEYVEGITLKNYMTRRGVLPTKELLSYVEQILSALEHAHAKGIVHRDIKPQNIMLLKNGLIKVMDFGIAKLPNAETVTMTDKAIGTVYYISPEQASGQPIDARSDLYSLGVLMYEMACGQLPFNADSPVSVALMQVNDDAVPPRKINTSLPLGVEQIIIKAMQKDPEERYQGAAIMLRHIQRIRENPNVIFRELRNTSTKKKKKKPHRASHSMLPIILGVMFAFLIAAGISGFVMLDRLFLSDTSDKAETITVTNFVNAYYTEELDLWFKESDYYAVTLVPQYDAVHDQGVIIRQEPKNGERRKVVPGSQKCAITLYISLGAETVELPDVVMEDYREAERICKSLGIAVKVERVSSETFRVGCVIRTEPEAGATMKLGETVTIYASTGPAVGSVAVPEFVGLTEIQTLRKLQSCGLQVGTVTYEPSGYTAGIVIDQSIAVSTMVHANTTIDFVVSGGPGYVPPADTTKPEDPTNPEDTDIPTPDTEEPNGSTDTPTVVPPDTTTSDPFHDFFLDWLNKYWNSH